VFGVREWRKNMNLKVERKGNCCLFEIGGLLPSGRVMDLHAVIMESLETSDEIKVFFRPDASVDVNAFQVLCAANRAAASAGKNLSLCGRPPSPLREVIEVAGLGNPGTCARCHGGGCLWADP